nr:putative RNA-directed DNA polymerase, eukaryota, reverse transcriptase zinc-binding domain protein [Tanacetum cinerariifolium]
FLSLNVQGLAQKAKKDWVKELYIKNKVNFVGLQETKIESIDLFSVKRCWGNLAFEYVHSDSIGNSGGILCVGDPNSFRRCSSTISDFFVILRGNGDVVMMGDFNEVRHKSDRFGSVFNAHGADIFNSFINKVGLEEIQLGWSMYTWCHKSATKMSKLDRFFVSKHLLNTCPNINAITLERYLLDHQPILLRESSCDYGPVPFWFFNYWIEVNGFDKLVMNSWYDAPSHGNNAILSFMSKLKFLKTRIKEWNTDEPVKVKGKFFHYFSNRFGKPSDDRVEIDMNFSNTLSVAKIAQKIKTRWCVEGDENNEPVKVKGKFFHYFSNRFGKPSDDRVEIDMNFSNTLSVDQKADLESMDVFAAVQYFFNHGDIPKGCNSTFITLILKIPGANMVKDFRPISLIGSFYKIIAKVLTNRLVGVLRDIVNEVQSAFIANRQILDGLFIVNEAIQWCKKKKKQALIFKVDFEKAYDSVRWDYLDDVLDKFGFGIKWHGWIQNCLRSSRGSILTNGSPTEEFQFFKGLKQGDPLSPFLFILIMESLHISSQRVVDAGLYTGIRLSSDVNLSHLFYVDDAMFVRQWSDSNIKTLVHVLKCFHQASGLKINMSKSKIMGIHVNNEKVNDAAATLG